MVNAGRWGRSGAERMLGRLPLRRCRRRGLRPMEICKWRFVAAVVDETRWRAVHLAVNLDVVVELSRRAEGKRAWSAGGPVVMSSPLYGPGAVSMWRASEMADGDVRLSSAMARARTAQRQGGHRWGGERAAASGGGIQCCPAWCVQRRSPSCHKDSDRDEEKIILVYRCIVEPSSH